MSTIDRILWNAGDDDGSPKGEIDEIVVHDCTVHVEQMSDTCWWIGIHKDGRDWSGNFTVLPGRRKAMTFTLQDDFGWQWDDNRTHASWPRASPIEEKP